MTTTNSQVSLSTDPRFGDYTFESTIRTSGTFTGAELQLSPDFKLNPSSLNAVEWYRKNPAGAVIASGTVVANWYFDNSQYSNVIKIAATSTGSSSDTFGMKINNIRNPYWMSANIGKGMNLFVAGIVEEKVFGMIKVLSDTVPLSIRRIIAPTADEVYVFFNKPVMLNYSGSVNISGVTVDPNAPPMTENGTDQSIMKFRVSSGSLLASGATYPITISNLYPMNSAVYPPNSVTLTGSLTYSSTQKIASVTPSAISFDGTSKDVAVAINLGTYSSNFTGSGKMYIEGDRGVSFSSGFTLSGSSILTTLHLDPYLMSGPKILTVDFEGTGVDTATKVAAFNINWQTAAMTYSNMDITSVIQNTGSNLISVYFNEPIRLEGIDGSLGTNDDAKVSIRQMTGTGSPAVTINTGATNSGVLVLNASGLNLSNTYELSFYDIVSSSYNGTTNTKKLPTGYDATNNTTIGYMFPIVWGQAGNNATRVVDSYPSNGMMNVPIGSTDSDIYFSKELSGATVSSTNIKLLKDNIQVPYVLTVTYSSVNLPNGGL